MQRHWQKKPLLVRQALANFKPLIDRTSLLNLLANEDVQSRLVSQVPGDPGSWNMQQGPFQRRQLPPLKQAGWTVLLQGMDAHDQALHELLMYFRFVSDARLDDLMISFATDQGGVGPHFDSYDVFLLQAQGRRRWRIGRQKDLSLQPGLPLKILAHFEPEQEFVLEPGDMLYLPPRYAHDGVAEGECMTYSIGFRSPSRAEIGTEMLQGLAHDAAETLGHAHYRDAGQYATSAPGEIPMHLRAFALKAVQEVVNDPRSLDRALGQYLTEPKPQVWFDATEFSAELASTASVRLDRRTRMMYDDEQVYINGESYLARGRDFALMRQLANTRYLSAKDRARLSAEASQLLADWIVAGWLSVY